jgi:hypothetical protein
MTHIKIGLVALISLITGALCLFPVVTSENGYVGSIVFFFLLVLVLGIAAIGFLIGLVVTATSNRVGPYIILFAVFLPIGFFGGAVVSKYLEIGAYRIEPMSPIVPAVANKVVFKKDATHDEVQEFWQTILSEPHNVSGSMTRPGVRGITSNIPENGHEVVTFVFFETATDEQRADIRRRIMANPSVYQYLENVNTSVVTTEAEMPSNHVADPSNRIPAREPIKFEYSR